MIKNFLYIGKNFINPLQCEKVIGELIIWNVKVNYNFFSQTLILKLTNVKTYAKH